MAEQTQDTSAQDWKNLPSIGDIAPANDSMTLEHMVGSTFILQEVSFKDSQRFGGTATLFCVDPETGEPIKLRTTGSVAYGQLKRLVEADTFPVRLTVRQGDGGMGKFFYFE